MHLFYSNVKVKVLFIFPIHLSPQYANSQAQTKGKKLHPKPPKMPSLYLDAYYVVAQLQS